MIAPLPLFVKKDKNNTYFCLVLWLEKCTFFGKLGLLKTISRINA